MISSLRAPASAALVTPPARSEARAVLMRFVIARPATPATRVATGLEYVYICPRNTYSAKRPWRNGS
jgi:hypothetical protein